ncbi:MAG: hypothetical protein AUK47_27680 [Deltaproteobacteria bacterium CG2_30_63_29]|nr:MAG: hypothetical protein AUK47_27680 [Deltaproteobacteria bacterium CG2_30_63_29]
MGIVSPLGYELETFQENLFAGVSGVGPITLFDAADLPTRIAGEVPWGEESITLRDRKIVFAVHAARQAMGAAGAAGPVGGAQEGEGAGLCLGLGLELFSLEDMVELRRDGAVPTASSSLREKLEFLQTPSDLCLHLISEEHGLSEAPTAHVSACAAGADAIGDAFHLIASGRRRWMLAGGTDSMINPMGVGGFCLLRATSTENDEPETASRPFDQTRTGFVMAEGAAILVLERLDDALARGATIHAELAGYGGSFDASAITAPHPEGRGAQLAMNRALADAQLAPEQVGAVNAHGTSTPMNDGIETLAIKAVFGARAAQIPVVSTKSMTGHLIAAAGALESVAAISCLEAGRLHPTINLRTPDPECDLDYVPNESREHAHDVVLSNSFGFGGQNASLVFKRWVES